MQARIKTKETTSKTIKTKYAVSGSILQFLVTLPPERAGAPR